MARSQFVRAFKSQTSDAAIFGTIANLEKPPGRSPRAKDVDLSKWYANLAESDRAIVADLVREAAELAAFSMFCVLDGVSAIEDGPDKGKLELNYTKNGNTVALNGAAGELLHDSYNSLCHSSEPQAPTPAAVRTYEVGKIEILRRKQTSNDGLDIHSVPPDSEIAIALPKNEHRKL